jgi:hypothetical protein
MGQIWRGEGAGEQGIHHAIQPLQICMGPSGRYGHTGHHSPLQQAQVSQDTARFTPGEIVVHGLHDHRFMPLRLSPAFFLLGMAFPRPSTERRHGASACQ